jgi:hypothetical protein
MGLLHCGDGSRVPVFIAVIATFNLASDLRKNENKRKGERKEGGNEKKNEGQDG